MIRALLILLVGVASAISLSVWSQIPVPALTARVTDQTATLSAEQRKTLEGTLRAFEARKGSQIAVLIVSSTAPETIEQYGLRVGEQWKLGRKRVDDGAVLIIAKDDRTMRIEVGYGLEGALNDATAKRIISELIAPRFREGDYFGGISVGLDRLIRVIDGEPLPARSPADVGDAQGTAQIVPVLLVAAVIIATVLRSLLGRFPGALATGGAVGLLAWFMAGAIMVGFLAAFAAFAFALGMGNGGVGGIYGGRGHRGGGFGGGFGGGGGGFGGGGASGRW